MNKFLDGNLVYDLREVIIKTNIFVQDPLEKEKFELICTVMDQFDNSIEYLNHITSVPHSSNDIILFLHHCCIIKDGINQVCNVLNISIKNTNILEKYTLSNPINLPPGEYKGDDKFFEYLRSLFFAHPFITDRSIPNPIKGEIQYSPYILTDMRGIFSDSKDSIGIMIYSNKRDMFHICIEYEDIKKYISQKFLLIKDIISEFQQIIDNKAKEWSNRKVNRKQSNAEILLDIISIFKERYLDYYEIKELYDYLTCNISNPENIKIVNKYRNIINNSISSICDCIDKMDYDNLYKIISPILNPKIKEKYPMMNYQLEKIYCYLNDDGYGDISWGLKQAEAFSKEFAKKWVKINANEMGFIEIKLLTTIACYYEAKCEVKND